MLSSQFRIVDIGIVAENKILSKDTVMVTPIESLPMLQGEIRYDPKVIDVTGSDDNGSEYNESIVMDLTVEAKWLPLGNTNRRTAPDVRRGERLLLWRTGNSDSYYWTSMGLDDDHRKLETIIFSVSATADENKDGTTYDNSYFLEISSHTKTITLHTSDANNEPFKYTFQFNLKDGAVILSDDVGNYFELDSSKTKLTLKNKDGTYFVMDKKIIEAYAPDTIDAKAEKHIKLTCGGSVFTLTPSETTLKTPKFTGKR